MGRGTKRKKPLVPPPMASLRRARAVTSSFHRLSQELQEASAAGRRADAARLSHELEQLGGCAAATALSADWLRADVGATRRRAAYQEASALTTARHRTAKFVFSSLTRHGLRPARGEPPLPLLEARAPLLRAARPPLTPRSPRQVGAVNTQLLSVPWLATRAIDLRSTHPRIEQLDFFALEPAAQYGAVVCAMARCARVAC